MFTPVAIVLATILVTLPYVARELIPLMQQQGREAERLEPADDVAATGGEHHRAGAECERGADAAAPAGSGVVGHFGHGESASLGRIV